MKAVEAAFNQEKALVGAFSVITNLRMELFEALDSARVLTIHVVPQVTRVPVQQNGATLRGPRTERSTGRGCGQPQLHHLLPVQHPRQQLPGDSGAGDHDLTMMTSVSPGPELVLCSAPSVPQPVESAY